VLNTDFSSARADATRQLDQYAKAWRESVTGRELRAQLDEIVARPGEALIHDGFAARSAALFRNLFIYFYLFTFYFIFYFNY
jgi:hypothetical protein